MVSSLNSLAVNSLSSVVVLFLQFMWCFLNSLWQRSSPNMQTLLVRWATVKGNCLSIEQYTRTKLIQDNFRADFRDCSWGPPSQLLAQFFFLSPVAVPEVFAKVNSAHYFWFLIWWMGATPPCQVFFSVVWWKQILWIVNLDRIHVVCEEKPPQGCAVATVSDKCEVHVLLKVTS